MGDWNLRSSVSISLALHALLFIACFALLKNRATINPKQTVWIEVERTPVPAHKKSENQIVQTNPGRITEHAKEDAFLGARTQEVDRQTISRNHTTVLGQSEPNPTARPQTKSVEKMTPPSLNKLGLALPKTARVSEQKSEPIPNWASQGEALPQDYVKGMKEADRTALNTREYVFFGYFQRIRERLDRAWVPILRERVVKMYETGRHLATDMDHTTRVMVTLNEKGEIVRLQVVSESGTHDLDDAAVKAFNLAGPFPNPPKGMIGKDGKIQIPWEFILKT